MIPYFGGAVIVWLSVEGTGVRSHIMPFRNLGSFVHLTFARVFQETLKAVCPFYLVSMPGEVKDPSQESGNNLLWTQCAS